MLFSPGPMRASCSGASVTSMSTFLTLSRLRRHLDRREPEQVRLVQIALALEHVGQPVEIAGPEGDRVANRPRRRPSDCPVIVIRPTVGAAVRRERERDVGAGASPSSTTTLVSTTASP